MPPSMDENVWPDKPDTTKTKTIDQISLRISASYKTKKGPVTGPLKILSSMFGQVYFKATRTTFSSKPFSIRTMYIPRGSEATSNLTSFSNLSVITSAPVMLYTETFDDVPKDIKKWGPDIQAYFNAIAITEEQAKNLVEFIRDITFNSLVHIHCFKGESRSKAVADFIDETILSNEIYDDGADDSGYYRIKELMEKQWIS